MGIDPVHPDTHPTRIAQAARALRTQMRREHDEIVKETDPARALARVEALSSSVMTLASMVEALAIRAGRAR